MAKSCFLRSEFSGQQVFGDFVIFKLKVNYGVVVRCEELKIAEKWTLG